MDDLYIYYVLATVAEWKERSGWNHGLGLALGGIPLLVIPSPCSPDLITEYTTEV